MRTLYITEDYQEHSGGVAAYGRALAQLCQDMSVLAHGRAERRSGDVHTAPFYWTSRLLWPSWYPLYRQVLAHARSGTDMLVAGHVLPVGTACWLAKNRLGTPYAVICHGMDVLMPGGLRKRLMLRVLRGADLIVANSEFTRAEMIAMGIPSKDIQVAYPGIKPPGQASDEAKRGLMRRHDLAGKKIVLSVGRLVERKGHDTCLKALGVVLAAHPEAMLVLVGSGPYEDALRSMASVLNLDDHVVFAGHATPEDLEAWYGLADLFVMPSRRIGGDVEGFGIVYLEAAARGLACVAGDAGGAPEAVLHEKTGLVVDPENPNVLAAALVRLLADDAYRNALGQAGKKRALAEFTWDKTLATLVARLSETRNSGS